MGTEVIQNGNTHNIIGGTRPGGGGNLFHSFGEFGVPTDNIANFLNEAELPTSNILSRVTGGNPSNIFGTIQTEGFGNANLFLMNPAGIVFGPDASLNIGGSTHFTTSDYLKLGDGVQFTALPSAQDTVLSVAPVVAFGFLGSNPASLMVGHSTLSVGEGEALSLIGGDIDISGGTLKSQDGQINLVSLNSPGSVSLSEDGGLQVKATQLGQIYLTSDASVSVDGESGGIIVVRGGNLMMEGSQISANATGSSELAMVGVSGYGIDIEVSEDVVLDKRSKVVADVSGLRDGKNIRVMASGILEIRNSILRSLAAPGSTGNAGNIEVHAENVLFNIDERGSGFDILGISSQAVGAAGDSGSIKINTNSFQMLGGFIATVTFGFPTAGGIVGGTGKVGSIELTVANDISIIGGFGGGNIVANAIFASGNAGDVLIHANNLRLTGDSAIQAVTALGPGDAGAIKIILKGNLDVQEASQIGSFSQGGGDAGDITIIAKDIFLTGVADPTPDGTPSGNQTLITAALQQNLWVTSGSGRAPSV
ncbi:MAG: filamentous hemagglutinin N-terminal domain-containing protein, partial [Nitrospirales bacterium]